MQTKMEEHDEVTRCVDLRHRLIGELFESETRYASILSRFVKLVESCGNETLQAKIRHGELGCLVAGLEQIAVISAAVVECIGAAIRDTGGDRIGRALMRFAGLVWFYEQYAGMFSYVKRDLDELNADEAFQVEFRNLVALERNREARVFLHMRWPNEYDVKVLLPSTLNAYLILPIQRIPRYELLLQQILDESERLLDLQGPCSWLEDENKLLCMVIDKIQHAATKMENAIKQSVHNPFALQLDNEKVVIQEEEDEEFLLGHFLRREVKYYRDMQKLIRVFVMPVLMVVYPKQDEDDGTIDGNRFGLDQAEATHLAHMFQSSGGLVLLQSILQLQKLSQHLIKELLDLRGADTIHDGLLWISNLLGIIKAYVSSYVESVSRLQFLSVQNDIAFPPWVLAFMQTYEKWVPVFFQDVDNSTGNSNNSNSPISKTIGKVEKSICAKLKSFQLVELLRLPLDHFTSYSCEIGLLVMRPGPARGNRSDLAKALAFSLKSRQFVSHSLNARYLAMALNALEQRLGEPIPLEKSLVRFGVLYVGKKPHYVWLFRDAIVYVPLSSNSQNATEMKLHGKSIISESSSGTIIFNDELTLTIPSASGPHCWTLPILFPKPTSRNALFHVWVKDCNECKILQL